MNTNAIKNSIAKYLGLSGSQLADFIVVLKEIVDKHTVDVLFAENKLKDLLISNGLSTIETYQILLLTKVNGFNGIVRGANHTAQADVDIFVRNAVNETGFTRAVILKLTAAIAIAAGRAFELTELPERSDLEAKAFVVPVKLYYDELSMIDRASNNGERPYLSLSDEQRATLENLTALGLPAAKRYTGKYMLDSLGDDGDVTNAIRLLEDAADECDGEAAGILADYYFDQAAAGSWSKAYKYYTGYGAIALSDKRRESLLKILELRKTNRKMVSISALLVLLILALLIIAPGKHIAIGIIGMVLIAITFAIGALRYKKEPYDRFTWLPVAIMSIWMAAQLTKAVL